MNSIQSCIQSMRGFDLIVKTLLICMAINIENMLLFWQV